MTTSLRKQLLALSVFILGLGAAGAVSAAGNASASQAADRDKVCTTCHDASWPKPILSYYQTKMGNRADPRTPGCQTCHGPSAAHLKNAGDAPDVTFTKNSKNTEQARNDVCLACHKGDKLTHWEGSQHQAQGLDCASCHTVHAPSDPVLNKRTQPEVCYTCHKTQRAEFNKISHMPLPEGKMACSDCHNPMGSAGPKLLKKNTVNETCYTCHAERRGPFLWEHPPASDNCLNCHTPHGSNIAPLLKSRPPFLCDECHNGPHQSASPVGPNVAGYQGGYTGTNPMYGARSCMNCHVMVHGSNSPAGSLLHR